jgi:hypothetical protein
VTCGVTSVVVLAITLLAVTELPLMVGVAFIALVLAVATLMGFIALMLTDPEGS